MRLANRLLVALVLAVTAIMGVYAVIALRQRAELVSDALARETDTLALALQAVTDNAIRDGRFEDLDGILRGVAEDPETFLVAVLDPEGRVLAGEDVALPACLPADAVTRPGPDGLRDWSDCHGRVRWVSLSVRRPARALLVARRATVVERDESASRFRILLTTLALAGGAGLVILFVLRWNLSRPLEEVMRGVRSVGGPSVPDRIDLPRASGELRELAGAFNQMADRLEGKRRTLIQEVEERIALEGRIRTEEKFAALGRLTGGIAHELGSPLNVIGVRAEAIAEDSEVPEEGRRQAREIVAEVDRVAELIRSLTHVARRDPMEPKVLDLVNALTGIVEEGRTLGAESGITLEFDAPEGSVEVRGDPNLLRIAFLNVVSNALQAIASSCEGKQGQNGPAAVRVRLSVEGNVAQVTIEDEGPGIRPEHLPRLFEPFFTTKDVGEGMGLGLAMTRGILEEHGGTVTVEPGEPGGLRVTCTLPLVPGSP